MCPPRRYGASCGAVDGTASALTGDVRTWRTREDAGGRASRRGGEGRSRVAEGGGMEALSESGAGARAPVRGASPRGGR
jgi:hypothetical protein